MTTNDRPNIVLFLTDEERERIWFPEHVRLPHRERLARQGMRFTNHHVQTFPCTPSRATILTGRHAASTGMFDNTNFNWQAPLQPTIPTLGTLMSAAGYRCSYLGKWHLGGESRRNGLEQYGFRDWGGRDAQGGPYSGHFVDGRIADRAVRWIARHADDDQPWLLVCSFVNPHDIMLYPRFGKLRVPDHGAQLPPNFADDLRTKPITQRYWRVTCDVTGGVVRSEQTWRRLINAYIDLHVEVDRHLGTVLDGLASSGCASNTLVMATSDHGDLAGAHGLRQKGANLYRENAQVPLTMVWPHTIPAGQCTERLSGAIDLAPTLLSVANAGAVADPVLGRLPGRDLSPLWSSPVQPVREEILITSDAFSSLGPAAVHRGFLRGIITEKHKYGRYFCPGEQGLGRSAADLELYDRVEDPAEMRNLAHPNVADGESHSLIEDLDRRLDDLIETEIGRDDVQLPVPDSRLAFLGRLWRRRARADRVSIPLAPSD